jgi:hypothetical protein
MKRYGKTKSFEKIHKGEADEQINTALLEIKRSNIKC